MKSTHKKNINDYLNERGPTALIQARVPADLVHRFRVIRKKKNLKSGELLAAIIRSFLDVVEPIKSR